jgi:hypothetical protein
MKDGTLEESVVEALRRELVTAVPRGPSDKSQFIEAKLAGPLIKDFGLKVAYTAQANN